MSTVARFHIDHVRFLDPQGEALGPLPDFARDPAQLVPMYRAMYLTRTFDAKAIALQRTGKLGTFASALGQEAIGVGVASAMRAEDALFPSYREHAAQLVRGVRIEESLRYWGGDERGSDFAQARHDFPNCVPIGTQVCHAAGAAYAFKLRGEARAAVCFLGDGGSSKGDFYEGLNFAAVWNAPLLIVVSNNQWAISVPRSAQTGAKTLAQKGLAGGLECVQVDGNDIIAMRAVMDHAIKRARHGHGGTVVEAVTYRLSDHTTADDARRYRGEQEVKDAWTREPMIRLRAYLESRKLWDDAKEEAWKAECAPRVDEEINAYLATKPQPVEAMFDTLYAELPADIAGQREEALRLDKRSTGH